ncbi:hypothetical protein PR003_g2523 [Phytophthora rubi]|uniref:Uncharacterized protein n=1 Tax=Phytophthora rubi TaxID=129364 RepID=A0A6A3P626_9STRA|nr:hypothetical protein PR002_g2266 [Phytophthora rubi]KAE9050546.1 hypothetical protein PR001_g2292 [Phytophthora rubi]KAE9356038.1 hypothetical protein PR003_g2523 [Phytophthora rubi]
MHTAAARHRLLTRLSEHPLLLVKRPFALPEEDADKASTKREHTIYSSYG